MNPLDRVLFPWTPRNLFTIRDLLEGVFVTGSIGSGKTSGSGAFLAEALLKQGFGGLVLVAKPSETDLWRKYARAYGREDDLIIFSQNSGYGFNFLDYESNIRNDKGSGIVHNIADVLKTVIKTSDIEGSESDKAFWDGTLKQLLVNAIELVQLVNKQIKMSELYLVVQSAPRTKAQLQNAQWREKSACFRLIHRAASAISDAPESDYKNQCARKIKNIENYFFGNWLNLSEKTRSIVEQMFFSFTDHFIREPLFDLFCKETNITPEDTIKGKIIVVDLPVLTYENTGRNAQILWKYIWQRAMQRRQISEKSRVTFLWADEAQYFLHPNDVKFQSTIREYRAATIYITQNLPNFYLNAGGVTLGKTRFQALAGNLSTKIFHANSDVETNQYASELIGKYWRWSRNSGYTQGEKASFSQGESESLSYKVEPDEFTRLPTGGPKNGFFTGVYVHKTGEPFEVIENGNIIKENYLKLNIKQKLL